MIEPRNVKGVMELLPQEQIRFNNIMECVEKVYKLHGFIPMDTPVFELSEILLAKAGGDTEKEIYRLTKGKTDMALRFDLTVPLAKYVAKNYNDLTFPFRRYQIGKSYRGEKPQKGRFRELYQCDIDIIGDENLAIEYDAEMPAVIYEIFKQLNIPKFTIRISNKKILSGIIDYLKLNSKKLEIFRLIDKYDKIGEAKMIEELKEVSIKEEDIKIIMDIITFDASSDAKIKMLEGLNISNSEYLEGVNEIKKVLKSLEMFGVPKEYFKLDLIIVRGLDYYTGTVYETMIDGKYNLGSLCSGGRYESLAENYINKKLPGVGISIGLTRVYDLLFSGINSEDINTTSKVLIIPEFTDEENTDNDIKLLISKVLTELKTLEISSEIYMQKKKFKAKMKYADKLNIPYVIIVGKKELDDNLITLKNMVTGEQKEIKIEDIKNIKD